MCFRYRAVKRCIECASHSRNPLTPQQLLFPFRDAFEPRTRLYAYSYNKPANSFPRTSPRRFRLHSLRQLLASNLNRMLVLSRKLSRLTAVTDGEGLERRERLSYAFFFLSRSRNRGRVNFATVLPRTRAEIFHSGSEGRNVIAAGASLVGALRLVRFFELGNNGEGRWNWGIK